MTARDLAELLGVSTMTIHRDLNELERQGLLRKARGRVTAQPSSLFESTIAYRLRTARREKEAIARYALTLVEPGQSIILDDSTTALSLATLLPNKAPLTVITNSETTLRELSKTRSLNIISLGGEYLPSYDAYFGLFCEQTIASLNADVCFVSTSAVLGAVAFHQNQAEVKVKRAMMNASVRHIMLIDHTKFTKRALNRFASLQDF